MLLKAGGSAAIKEISAGEIRDVDRSMRDQLANEKRR